MVYGRRMSMQDRLGKRPCIDRSGTRAWTNIEHDLLTKDTRAPGRAKGCGRACVYAVEIEMHLLKIPAASLLQFVWLCRDRSNPIAVCVTPCISRSAGRQIKAATADGISLHFPKIYSQQRTCVWPPLPLFYVVGRPSISLLEWIAVNLGKFDVHM